MESSVHDSVRAVFLLIRKVTYSVMVSPTTRPKDSVYCDYWEEMVKCSVHRDSHEIPAIAEAAEIKGKHVIDAGYDPGRLILPFVELAETITCVREHDWSVNVIDKMLREKNLRDRVQVVQSPSVGLPIDDDSSESTYCMWVIHYDKSRWEKIVQELVRVTKPNAPIVVGFSSGERDLPRLEEFVKPEHQKKMAEFDKEFLVFCKENGWKVEVRKLVLPFEFKSPDWAFEVFSNTFMKRKVALEKQKEILDFLRAHAKNGKTTIEQELRLYIIRAPEEFS